MSRNNKSILAVAVLGALYTVGASAQVNISVATTASPAVAYAAEITKPAAGVLLTNVAANDIAFNLGYNFSDGEVRFARISARTTSRSTASASRRWQTQVPTRSAP